MSIAEPTAATESQSPAESPKPAVRRRPLGRRVMHVVRRGHLYLGLFLLPWAILYGATGFLFNHPGAFSDTPTTPFSRSELSGTPMESVPSPSDLAQEVVTALRTRANPPVDYQLVQPEKAKYNREFAFATVKADGQDVSIAIDAAGNGGTVRSRVLPAAAPAPVVVDKAPFAIGSAKGGPVGGGKGGPPGGGKGGPPGGGKGGQRGEKGGAGGGPRPSQAADTLVLDSPLHDRVKAAVPTVLERTGFPSGEVTVTSVPDLNFMMSDGEKVWTVTYNAQNGTVAGKSNEESRPPGDELSTRRFLTRMHLAHGYPGEQNAKWFWAVIVDVMAFVMVFWGISGIFMWWQIRATRLIGFFVLVLSIAAATALGMGMHDMLSAGGR